MCKCCRYIVLEFSDEFAEISNLVFEHVCQKTAECIICTTI